MSDTALEERLSSITMSDQRSAGTPSGLSPNSPAPISHGSKLSAEEYTAADEAKNKLERMVKLEAMVEKRKTCFMYLKKIHQGDSFWLNCVLLRRQADLAIYATELPRQRVTQLFYLGLSLAKLLQSKGGTQLVRAILQLLEEWEFHFALAGSAHQSVKAMMAKNMDQPFVAAVADGGEGVQQEQVVARLYKFNNDVVYEHLLTPNCPFALDYFEVVFSLCDIICLIYNKFMDEECYGNPYIFDALVKVDSKIKHHVLNVIAKEFTDMSINIVKAELAQNFK